MKIPVQLLLVSILIFNSCSVKKRTYRDGFYISWNNKSKHAPQLVEKNDERLVKHKEEPVKEEVVTGTNENSFASVKNDLIPVKENKPKLNLFKDTCGDVITLRKGTEVKAKVLEINETEIKYRRCDNLDGPLIIINKNDVYSIKYTNGILEHFDRTLPPVKESNSEKPTHPLAMLTLGLTIGIFALSIFGLIAALIVGRIAKQKILRQPDKYSGLEMVKICTTICWVILILGISLAILFIILLPH